MPTTSNKLRLTVPTTSDPFSTAQIANNWLTIDASPGLLICTSGTRPLDWGANQTGMGISETDTGLVWRWTGSAWARPWPAGRLGGNTRISDFTTASTTAQIAVSAPVTVPAGGRAVHIIVGAHLMDADNGRQMVSVYRGTTLVREWTVTGKVPGVATWNAADGSGHSYVVPDAPTAGAVTYHMKTRAVAGIGGTVYLRGTAQNPLTIEVCEV